MPLTGNWKSRCRFALFALPRAVTGQFTATRMTGYAIEFSEAGDHRNGSRCLKLAIAKSIDDPHAFQAALEKFLGARQSHLAAKFANTVFDHTGVMPGMAARLTGEFFFDGAYNESLCVLDRLVESLNVDLDDAVPGPAFSRKLSITDIREQLGRQCEEQAPDHYEPGLNLSVARLCFRFSAFDVSAKLFGHDESATEFNIEDQIAYAYSLLRSDKIEESKTVAERFDLCEKEFDVGIDWRILNATLIFIFHSTERAKSEIGACIRDRIPTHLDLENIVQYCDQIVDSIAHFPERLTVDPDRRARRQIESIVGPAVSHNDRQKIFVCGNGWSGSGAVCDALADFEIVAVAPDMPIDRFINNDTNNELMFVQGEGGLGRLWRQARDNQCIDRMDLWELFRCHVVGMGPIGFAEHKSANAGASLLERHGSQYASQFQSLCRGLTMLDNIASLDEVQNLMVHVTNSLTELIFDAAEGQFVVFNNAMFGANLDMVAIFSNYKLVVVVRDPLDQYADRREQDLKHWMSASRFVSFYKSGRAAFHLSKSKLPPKVSTRIREIQFEKFVQDSGYRDGVLDWLLDGLGSQRNSTTFNPESSSGNVGIYNTLLTKSEAKFLDSELREWRTH